MADEGGYKGPNRRRNTRYTLSLPGRFMRADKLDYPCRLADISISGANLSSTAKLQVGERLIVYLMHLGGLEGTVVRVYPGGFAMTIDATQRKRDKLALQIPKLAAQPNINESEERQYPRVPAKELSLLVLPDGAALNVPLQDVSLSGASIITAARPPIGTEVMLGSQSATVVRHHDQGIAVEFATHRFEDFGTFERSEPTD
jgi:hypothetical protein